MRWRAVVLALSAIASAGLVLLANGAVNAQESKEAQKADSKSEKADDLKKAKDEARPKDETKPPVANPLQNLIQKLLPPPAGQPRVNININVRPRGAAANGQPLDPDARDHIDGRAAKDRRQSELLRKANAALDARDWAAALELLQTLLAQEEDSVTRVGKEWQSVREQAMRLMLRLPDETVQTFRQRSATEAARRLGEAERSGRVDQLAQVAARFLLLEPGQDAAWRLAIRHMDRGEFALASRWFRWLEDAKAPVTKERHWQLQAALAARQAGDKESAEKWLKKNQPKLEEAQASRARPDDESIEIGGTRLRVSDWWSSLPNRVVAQSAPSEWPMFFGAPNRAALNRGGEPLLLPRWRQPLTQVQPLQRQIEMLIEDMHDQNRATISVCQPLMINGLVVLRTLAGVQVIEVETGQLLWSTAERFKAEDLIGPGNAPQTFVTINRGARFFNGVQQYDFTNASWEQHPLAQLLFANANFGVISSDGRQLFSIEDDTFVMQQVLGNWGNEDLSKRDPLRRNWSSNKLVSYDLRSGRPLWTVGGAESDEPFQPDLPGVFFFGAPVADGHELFVIGERDGEIRLFCLAEETGKPLWTQLLATAESTISRDAVRRQFAAQVAIADGVVICPTTVGWLAAVDRVSRQLLWVHRYSVPQQNNQRRGVVGQPITPMLPWGQRWLPSAPVIVGDAVIYTPQELFDEQQSRTTNAVCLDLQTGVRRWLRPKENWLALNGVADGKVLLLGQNNVGAFSISNGEPAWSETIPNSEGVPSGLGAITREHWHVPLSSGQIWTFSLKDGSRVGRQWATPGTRIGNLALYRGGVISSHPTGLTRFEQRESMVEQIQKRKARDPQDAVALLTEASMLQLEHKSNEAWSVLQQVRGDSITKDLRPRYLETLRAVLTDVIQQDPAGRSAELATFGKWLHEPSDELQAKRFRIEHSRANGEYVAAFDELLALARGETDLSISLNGPPATAIRLDAWISGHLSDLWSASSGNDREEMDRRMTEEARRLAGATRAARERGLIVFAFHPAMRDLHWKEIDAAIEERDISRAELALLDLTEGNNSREAARGWQKLVGLYRSLDLKDDAAAAGQRLSELGDVLLAEGVTAKEWVAKEIEAGRLAKEPTSKLPDWSTLNFKMERSVGYQTNGEQIQECPLPDARWPFFTAQRFQYQMLNSPVSSQRLAMSQLGERQLEWSLPLRQKPTTTVGYGALTRTIGHQILVYHREVLHLLSPVDRRVVWTRPMESRATAYFDPMQTARRQPTPMQNSAEFQSRPMDPTDEAVRNSLLVVCTPELVGYRGRRTLTMTDAATGKFRWELRELPNDARVQATNDLIYVSSATRWPNGLLLRARDGRSLPLDAAVRDRFQAAKTSLGADLLTVSRVERNSLAVERWNPLAQQSVWRQVFPSSCQFAWLDSHTLATLSDGKLTTLDIETQETQVLGTVKAADLAGLNHRRFLVADHDRLFLIVSGERTNYYGDEFASVPVNGKIFAFDRHSGGELWSQKVDNQGLILNHFAASPVLLFSARRFEQRGRAHVTIQRLLMLDKKTGRKLYEDEFANQFSGYRGLNLNLAERQIELLTYSDRLRFVGTEPEK